MAARPEELSTRMEIGATKAASLVAAFQLGRHAQEHTVDSPVVRGPEEVARIARRALGNARRERVPVLVCDAANRLKRTIVVSEGSIARSLVPVREILNAVLRNGGRSFALAHNHPSDNPEPSDADFRATDDVMTASRAVGLRFLGHVVVARQKWAAVNPDQRKPD